MCAVKINSTQHHLYRSGRDTLLLSLPFHVEEYSYIESQLFNKGTP